MTTRTASRRSQPVQLGRTLGFERSLLIVLGLLGLLAGLLGLLLASGALGGFLAQRPVLAPTILGWWADHPKITLPLAVIAGIVLLVLGIWWVLRALRPESKPDVPLRGSDDGSLLVTSSALTEAVRTDAETIDGVRRAQVRMSGDRSRPTLRLTLDLREGTNVRSVWEELDDRVLARARHALDVAELPTAIRLRLDRAPRQRVS